MSNYTPSNTYKVLFDDIIGSYLSSIFKEFPDFCLRDRYIPYNIEKKYTEYKNNADKCMEKIKTESEEHKKLDRHKLASCMCGAIIEIQPICCISKITPPRVNETLALYVGLSIIKHFMIFNVIKELSDNTREDVKNYLVNNFDVLLPGLDKNICDTQEYEQNLLNALMWTHYKCDKIGRECFHYDIWAYSKIFYHLELYNKPRLENMYLEYLKTNCIVIKEQEN